jgi:hypothetical protein
MKWQLNFSQVIIKRVIKKKKDISYTEKLFNYFISISVYKSLYNNFNHYN